MASHSASPAAHSRAVTKYMKENYEQISIKYKKGERQPIADHAAKMGESVPQFVKRAIKETMENDNKKTQ